MPDQMQHPFITIEIDTKLLSATPQIHTNWYVITGAPCCGKTTLIDQLAARGFKTVPETGRLYIEQEFAKGRSLEEIRQNEAGFVHHLFNLQAEVERRLAPHDLLFLDRALPECITFHRINRLNPNEILPVCTRYRYACIFILDRFPLQQDGVRTEDDLASDFLDEWLERDSRTMGYNVVRVPVLSINDRLEYILDRVQLD